MRLTITKSVTKGTPFITITLDGKPLGNGRELTGHTMAAGLELSEPIMQHVEYGTYYYPHDLPKWSPTQSADEILDVFEQRIRLIRTWVRDCQARDAAQSGTASLVIV